MLMLLSFLICNVDVFVYEFRILGILELSWNLVCVG